MTEFLHIFATICFYVSNILIAFLILAVGGTFILEKLEKFIYLPIHEAYVEIDARIGAHFVSLDDSIALLIASNNIVKYCGIPHKNKIS